MNGKKTRYIWISLAIVILIVVIAFVIIKNLPKSDSEEGKVESETIKNNNLDAQKDETDNNKNEVTKNPIVTMEIKNYGTVKIELYPKVAPNTVKNFISLINEGYYDGLTFHRIVPGFVVQGGDKEGTGAGKTEYSIRGEFTKNGFKNDLKHEKGVISMARADYSVFGLTEEGYNSAFSQFFIMLESQRSLDGLYAAFGKVIEGMDIIENLENIEIDSQTEKPINPPVIQKMTVETFGVNYEEPERIKSFDINGYIQKIS